MATAQSIIDQAAELAGNTSISATHRLAWLNRFLEAEYRRKYPWQRQTASIAFASGGVSNTANWPSTLLDTYQHEDGSCGRYTDSGSSIVTLFEWTYRTYIAKADRNTSTGPPQRIVADPVTGTWYVYPKTDQAYTVSADYYQLPAAVAVGDTPLWSSHAPDEILVQAVKVAQLFHQDDTRYTREYAILYGDNRLELPGLLPTYRRRVFLDEGVTHPSALDPRIYLTMPVND